MASIDKARVLMVDDHEVLRIGLRNLLNEQPDLEVVADFGTLREGREALLALKPDLLLLDLGLGDEFSLGWLPRLSQDSPATRIVILSAHSEQLYAERVLRSGAHAYLMKTAPLEQLLHTLRRVLQGQLAVSPEQHSALLQRSFGAVGQAQSTEMSTRELEVLRHVAAGRSTAEIAQILNRSVKTVESHKQSLKFKLGAESPAQLIRFAIAHFELDAF